MSEKHGTKIWDDIKGGWLIPSLTRAARNKEMGYVKKMNKYQKVPYEENFKVTGKPPIRLTWVNADKSGGVDEPNARSRLVATDSLKDSALREHYSAALLEPVRLLLSWTATDGDCSLAWLTSTRAALFFYAPSCQPSYQRRTCRRVIKQDAPS